MTRARNLANLGNKNAITADIGLFNIGIGSTQPTNYKLDVVGGNAYIGGGVTITGNLSVGGTITYEDVTNVDAVGIITAAKGFRATAGGVVVTAGVSTFPVVAVSAGTTTKDLLVTGVSTFSGAVTASDTLTAAGNINANGNIVGDNSTNITGISAITASGAVATGALTVTGSTNVNSGHVNVDAGYSFQWDDSFERIEQSDAAIEFFTNNSEKMRLAGSNIGIGTTNPISIVHAHGASGTTQITSKNVGGNATFYAEASSSNTAKMVLMQAGVSSYDLRTGSADALQIYRDSTELLRITSTGDVNIHNRTAASSTDPVTVDFGGQYTPDASITHQNLKIKIFSNASGNDSMGFTAGQSGISYVSSVGAGHLFYTAPSAVDTILERMRITHDGKVGIGSEIPAEVLDVNGTIQCLNELRSKSGNDLLLNAGSANRDVKIQVNDVDMMKVIGSTGYAQFTGAADLRLTLGSTGTAGTNDANWLRADTANLMYNSASGDHKWEVGGTEKLRLTSAGLLLLGTTDTGFSGSLTTMTVGNTSTSNTGITIASSASTGYSRLHFADGNSGTATYAGWIAYSHSQDELLFSTAGAGSAKMTINAGGDVNISGMTTTGALVVNHGDWNSIRAINTNGNTYGAYIDLCHHSASPADGDEAGEIRFLAYDSAGSETLFGQMRVVCNDVTSGTEDGQFEFFTRNDDTLTEVLRIRNDGHVGILNDTPSSTLSVKDTTEFTAFNSVTPSSTACMLQLYNNPPNESANDHATIQFGVNGGTHNRVNTISAVAESASNRRLAFVWCTDEGSGRTEKMRLTSSGGLMLGRSVANAGNATGLGMEINGLSDYAMFVRSQATTLYVGRNDDAGTILQFTDDGTSVGSVSTNGNSLPSDRNYKKNINSLSLGLNLIEKLNPVSYNYKFEKDGDPLKYGLIAQDLEQSLEEVGVEKDSASILQYSEEAENDPNLKNDQSKYNLCYEKLIPVLINSVKELKAENDELKSLIKNSSTFAKLKSSL